MFTALQEAGVVNSLHGHLHAKLCARTSTRPDAGRESMCDAAHFADAGFAAAMMVGYDRTEFSRYLEQAKHPERAKDENRVGWPLVGIYRSSRCFCPRGCSGLMKTEARPNAIVNAASRRLTRIRRTPKTSHPRQRIVAVGNPGELEKYGGDPIRGDRRGRRIVIPA